MTRPPPATDTLIESVRPKPEGDMVLLVLGMPILVLFLALALERLERSLLPARQVDLSDPAEELSPGDRLGRRAFTRPG